VKERIASSFISKEGLGRIILAGDAAHVHPINGGQGLNTGMADAFSLAWRLSLAIHGSGLESDELVRLIKSYDIERRAIAQSVIDVATTLVRDTKGNAEKYLATIAKNGGFITGK
jgi:2-polyprenyl-6-methoxyphenol hydroxylase-like FAD-dependent oxidoreductase